MAVKRRDRLARRAWVEVPIALPYERWVWPPCPVGVTKRFRDLERIGTRCNHERGECVAKVVEFEPGELIAPGGFSLVSGPLDGLGEDVSSEVIRVPDSVGAWRREDETSRRRAACQQLRAERLHGRRAEVHTSLLPRLRSALDAFPGGPDDQDGALIELDFSVAQSKHLS